MPRTTDMFSTEQNELSTPELYYMLRRTIQSQIMNSIAMRRKAILITGNSGVGKSSIMELLAKLMNNDQQEWIFGLFNMRCNGLGKFSATIPFMDKADPADPTSATVMRQLPMQVWQMIKDYLAANPKHRAILNLDEILSCQDEGFQVAIQSIPDAGWLGSVHLTPDEFSRLHIVATGNTEQDGNVNCKANRFFMNRFRCVRFVPSRIDFVNSVVEQGIVSMHPLVVSLLGNDILDTYWLNTYGPHEVNPRTLEAVSQVCDDLADPMTGMLPTPDDDKNQQQYREVELELKSLMPAGLVVELMSTNESMKGLTSITDIVDKPDSAALPAGPLAQLMQVNLIDSYLKRGGMNNLTPWRCLAHFAVFCDRLDSVVKPAISVITQLVRDRVQWFMTTDGITPDNMNHLETFYDVINTWRKSMLTANLTEKFDHSDTKIDSALFEQKFGPQEKKAKATLVGLARGNPLQDYADIQDTIAVSMPDLSSVSSEPAPEQEPMEPVSEQEQDVVFETSEPEVADDDDDGDWSNWDN